MNKYIMLIVGFCGLGLCAGCGGDKPDSGAPPKKVPPPEARIAEEPVYTPFTNTQQTVTREEIISTNQLEVVEVDFNNDGQLDLVVSEKPVVNLESKKLPPISPKVSVFIQQSAGKYYLSAIIQEEIRGQVIGLAHKKGQENRDLFVFYRYEDGDTEMVRYQNNGKGFTRIKEGVDIKAPAAAPGKP